ncbi:hypothetical protein RN001_004342 [Aquatica leii]|uniref:Uncharacterized protein n=1 Tax=Aquatica leii TaxID=1421715 RepID=A0AAN7SPI0_9COLE|nr:hypothetical protein RN001_004342 [Aquatica leii]
MEASWSIVKLIDDDTVQAVPTSWINGNMCFWPPYPTERLTFAIKRHEPHSQNWTTYPIKVFRNSTYTDYQIARQKEKKSETQSDTKIRKRIQRVYSSEEEGGKDLSILLNKPPALKKAEEGVECGISGNSNSLSEEMLDSELEGKSFEVTVQDTSLILARLR